MAQIVRDMVGTTTTGTGTGQLDFGPAVDGFAAITALSPAPAHGDTFYYSLRAANGQWETGSGMYLTLFGSGLPRITRSNPYDGSAGPNTLVDFTEPPDCFIILPARAAVTFGPAFNMALSANQVVAAATPAKVLFNTGGYYNSSGYGGQAGWSQGTSKLENMQPGSYSLKAKVEALTTFAGDSYLSLIYNYGIGDQEVFRGPVLNGAKNLWIDCEVGVGLGMSAYIQITSGAGGTIDSTLGRSQLFGRWLPGG